jgi:cellulose synthase/poly-beta-1,6-N-acetylglucosamine synthase-like glycosyltransferase
MFELAGTVLVFFGSANLIATIQVCNYGRRSPVTRKPLTAWLIVYGGASATSALLLHFISIAQAVFITAGVLLSLTARRHFKDLHAEGFLSISTAVLSGVATLFWLACFSAVAEVDGLARFSLWMLTVTAVVLTPVYLLGSYLTQEVLCRVRWSQPQDRREDVFPEFKISVHVPCYAEPPDVVNVTLDALAHQRYSNFEVLVIDNNTKDEKLWHPVQRHCEELGSQFRFFHVDPLSGAKAGALNFALMHTDPQVDLIAVVDADYRADVSFLSSLVGYFADDQLAFVQTQHDYRDWENNGYLRGCYGEYRAMYASYMISRSERNAALTTGTMCLIRRQALESVGGWAEWCSTEDSELAIRLHAAGFSGIYLAETYGRGLIPEDFAGYKRQRFRWIYGPTQEFRRHWRLFLPKKWAAQSKLTPVQKVLFAYHGSRDLVTSAASLAMFIWIMILAIDLCLHPPAMSVPMVMIIFLTTSTLQTRIVTFGMLRCAAGFSWQQTCRAMLSEVALTGVAQSAGFSGWLTSAAPFLRTNKFRLSSNRTRAALSGLWEGVFGTITLAIAISVLVLREPGDGLILAVSFALFSCALSWLSAPLIALYADRCLQRSNYRSRHSRQVSPPNTKTDVFIRDETRPVSL